MVEDTAETRDTMADSELFERDYNDGGRFLVASTSMRT